jgi:hypothetical protein
MPCKYLYIYLFADKIHILKTELNVLEYHETNIFVSHH